MTIETPSYETDCHFERTLDGLVVLSGRRGWMGLVEGLAWDTLPECLLDGEEESRVLSTFAGCSSALVPRAER